jgi:hypothetical protein
MLEIIVFGSCVSSSSWGPTALATLKSFNGDLKKIELIKVLESNSSFDTSYQDSPF